VDYEEAFAELGLKPPTSADAIRRAYLRMVRAHSPEGDPEGFRCVREAYDTLRNAPWCWQAPSERRETQRESPGAPLSFAEVIPDEVAPSGMEVAPSGVGAQAERVHVVHLAVPADDPVAVGENLIQLLNAPGVDASLHAWPVIDVALRLIEQGELPRARRLFEAFEARTNALGTGKEMGAYLIARSTLVAELLALESKVPQKLLVELAAGVRDGDFDDAIRVFDAARSKRWSLGRVVAANAPNLRRALAVSGWAPPRGGRFAWPWISIAYLVFQFLRSCVVPAFSDEPRSDPPRAQAKGDASVQLTPEDPSNRSLFRTAAWIDEAVRLGDCNTVHEQWPYYLRAVGHPSREQRKRDNYFVRRAQALRICAELAAELPEEP
jgi:hypothetical protein